MAKRTDVAETAHSAATNAMGEAVRFAIAPGNARADQVGDDAHAPSPT